MALPNPLEAFTWGPGGSRLTPEQIARHRQVADALLANGIDASPVAHWTQGLARVANAAIGAFGEYRTNQAEAANIDAGKLNMASILNGGVSGFPAAPTLPAASPANGSVAAGLINANDNPNLPSRLDFARSDAGAGDRGIYRNAIASIESEGSGGYSAIGPTNKTMGRALGRYQVMESNIAPWSKEALGREVSADEFLANPALQDAIFDHKFGSYVQAYGPEGAAQAWFAGPGGVGKLGRKDVLGTSVADYSGKFSRALGGKPAPVQVASLDPSAGMPAVDPYSNIPATDTLGDDQRAKFRAWNPDPIGGYGKQLSGIDPALQRVVERAKQIAGTDFTIGSGMRTPEMQQQAKKFGWSGTDASDHLGGGAVDLWPVDENGAVVFDKARQGTIVSAMKQAAKELGVDMQAGADFTVKNPLGVRSADMPHFGMVGQTPMQGPIPAARPDTQVASLDQSAGFTPPPAMDPMSAPVGVPFQPSAAAPTPTATQKVAQALDASSDPSTVPVMAGGTAGALPAGSQTFNPAIIEALSSPYIPENNRRIAGLLMQQQMERDDPSNKLDMEYRRAQIDALKAKPAVPLTDDQREYADGVRQGFKGTLQDWIVQARKAGATNVTVGGGNNSKFIEKSDEAAAGRLNDIVSAGNTASEFLGDIETLAGLSTQLTTGKGAQFKAAVGPYAQALGIDIENLPEAEAYKSIINKLAPQMRPAGSGAASDFDAKQFLGSLPQLGNSPEGNAIIRDTLGALQKHRITAAEIASKAYLSPDEGGLTWQQAEKEIRALGNPYEAFSEYRKRLEPPSTRTGSDPAKGSGNSKRMIDGYTIEEVE